MPQFLDSDSAKALLPALAAIVVALIGAVVSWAKDLNSSARRSRVLDEATKRVQFWDLWLKTVSPLSLATPDEIEKAKVELRAVSQMAGLVSDTARGNGEWTLESYKQYRRALPSWKRYLLLYVQPNPLAVALKCCAYFLFAYPWLSIYFDPFAYFADSLFPPVHPIFIFSRPVFHVVKGLFRFGYGYVCWTLFRKWSVFHETADLSRFQPVGPRSISSRLAHQTVTPRVRRDGARVIDDSQNASL
jgi:hypothetical protein